MNWLPACRFPKGTPPVFLVHGGDDIVSPPEHSVFMYLALKRESIPAELHVYGSATHGFGVLGRQPAVCYMARIMHKVAEVSRIA